MDTPLLESPDNDISTDSELASNLAGGGSGEVFADDIVDIKITDFSGHVYNLQTESSWYVAEGIITHNCRCFQAPITKTFRELGIDRDEFAPSTKASSSGQIAADTTYDQWLRTRPVKEQIEMLGPSRQKMFANGMKVDKFVDNSGKTYTLEQLKGSKSAPPLKVNLSSAETSIRKLPHEEMRVFNTNGETIFSKVGGKSSVEFTVDEANSFKGSILTHNHPNSRSFTPADISVASNYGLSEIRAVSPMYDHSLKPPMDGWNSKTIWEDNLSHVHQAARAVVETNQAAEITAGRLTITQADDLYHHSVMELFAQWTGAFYERKPI